MGERMTPAELDAAEALANAATEGPWVSSGGTGVDRDGVGAKFEWVADCSTKENAAFIAAARELVPRLVAEVRARDTVIEAVREVHRKTPFYELADECGHKPEEHHIGNDPWGDELCLDSPTGEYTCAFCGENDPELRWPCATIRALEGATE